MLPIFTKNLRHKCLGGPNHGSVKTLKMNGLGIKTPEPVLKFLFNKVAGLNACNFFKKRLQHRRCHECCPLSYLPKNTVVALKIAIELPVVYLQWFSVKIYGK